MDFKEILKGKMQDAGFREEWEAVSPEYDIVNAMLDGRAKYNFSQRELARMTGITQADICKMENANANPSLHTLKKLASGLGMKLKIEFVPDEDAEKELAVRMNAEPAVCK